jgi:hypothetical protein
MVNLPLVDEGLMVRGGYIVAWGAVTADQDGGDICVAPTTVTVTEPEKSGRGIDGGTGLGSMDGTAAEWVTRCHTLRRQDL